MNLQIRKKTAKVWAHVSDSFPVNILSSLYCKTDGDYFRYVELGGRQRARFHFSEITIYDDTSGGAPETFLSALSLMIRLEELEYPAFSRGSGGGGGVGFQPTIVNPQNGQVIQYIDGVWVNSSLDLNGDRFTVVQPIDVTGLDITLPIGFKWVINGVEYENTSAFLQTITLSSTGTERGDIFVANENNTFEYIQGVEDVANVVYPQTPPNKLFLTSIKVNDSSISTPIEPELGADYIPKENPSLIAVTGVGNNAMAGGVVTDKARYIDFSSYFGSGNVLGLNSDASVFIGQDVRIKNNTGVEVPLSHNSGTDLKFIFPDGLTYTMQPNEIATFRLRNTTTKEIDFIASNLCTPTADQVSYDNTSSGLLAETVQEMGDELSDKKLDKVTTGSMERVYSVNEANNQAMIPTMEQFVSDTDIIDALESITTEIASINVVGKTMYKGQLYVSDSPAYIYLAYDDNQIIRK